LNNVWETAAVIRLIDHLSGPLDGLAGKVEKHSTGMVAAMQRASSRMAEAGRTMTFGLTVPIVEAGRHMTEHAIEFSKVENTLQGVLLNRARTMRDLRESQESYAKSQKAIIDQGTKGAFDATDGLANALEFQHSAMSAIKAGHDANAALAIAAQATFLGIAGRTSQAKAADDLISIGNAFGIVTRNADGTTKSIADLNREFGRIGDLLATMSTNANMTYDQAVDSLKLSAPIAHTFGMDPGLLGALSEAQAEQGIRGSEASVAQRSLLMALASPKASAIPALRRAGVNYFDFVHMLPGIDLGADAFVKYAHDNGYALTAKQARSAYAKAHALADSGAGENDFLGEVGVQLSGQLLHAGGKHNALNNEQTLKFASRFFASGIDKLDLAGFILKERDAHGGNGMTPGELRQVFEGRQVPRLSPFLNPKKEPGVFDPFEFAMARMFGENWKEEVRKGHAAPTYIGNLARMSHEHSQLLEGAMTRMKNSFVDLEFALYKAGAFDDVAAAMNAMAKAIHSIAQTSPGALKTIAEVAAGLALLGPTMWIGGKLGGVAVGLARIGGAVTGLTAILLAAEKALPSILRPSSPAGKLAQRAASPAAVVAAETGGATLASRLGFLRGGAIPLALLGLTAIKYDMNNGNAGRTWLRNLLGLPDPEGDVATTPPFAAGGITPGVFAFGRQGFKTVGNLGPNGYAPVAPLSAVPTMARPDLQAKAVRVEGEASVEVTSTVHSVVSLDPGLLVKVTEAAAAKVLATVPLGESMSGSNSPAGNMTGLRAARRSNF